MADAFTLKYDKYLIMLLLLGVVYTVIVMVQVAPYKALPSPLFGGDYYHQLGYIYSMYERAPWEWFRAGAIDGALPAYYPLYGIIVTIFGKVLGLDPLGAMFKLNILLPIASLVLFYILIKELFSSSKLALLGSAAIVSFANFPILKYTEFTSMIIVPIFLYTLYLFFKEQKRKNALMLGLSYGAMSIAHSTSFMYASVMVVAIFAYLLYERKERIVAAAKEMVPDFALAFGLGFLIALIMWYEPIFIYHGNPQLKSNIWSLPDLAMPAAAIKQLIDGLTTMFFNTSSLLTILVSLLSLGGLVVMISVWKSRTEPEVRFLGFVFAVTFVFVYSYFITSPLLDTHLIPTYSQPMYLSRVAILLGIFFIKEKIEPNKEYNQMFFAAFVLAFVLSRGMEFPTWSSNQWVDTAKADPSPVFSSLQNYLLANTSVNDVILTNNEMSFAIFALSGREVMVSRRSQNDPFLDFDTRELDSAKILYGNNTSEKLDLLREYKIKYVYYDLNWVNLDYSFDSQGQITNYFDPLMVVTSPSKTQALDSEGISYFQIYSYIDPSVRDQYTRKYNITLVSPANYDFNSKGIWKSDIDPYLQRVWEYDDPQGKQLAVLYKVELPS